MTKVLYLLNHAGKAGTERYVHALVEKLNQRRINAFFAYNEEGLLVDRIKALGVEACQLTMKHPFDIKAAWKLSRICKKLDIDIVHTHYLRENYISLISRLFNRKVKVFYTNHFILRNNFLQRVFNRILGTLQANVIAVCNKGKDMMISNGVNPQKISVVFNGVDPGLWGSPEKSSIRDELGIDDDTFVLFCASRFAHDKGHDFLIKSLAAIKKLTHRKFKCLLAGDGPLLEEIKQLTMKLSLQEDVIFLGFQKDMKRLYMGSDLYVNSAQHEALSFAIIEALAAGLPVIAADIGGNRDIINDDTDCGILVEYDHTSALASAIVSVMNDGELHARFRKNALKTVDEKFNIDKIVDETYNLYVKSLGKRI